MRLGREQALCRVGHQSQSAWRRCRCRYRCHQIQGIQGCKDYGGYYYIIINISEHQGGSGLADPVAQLLKPDWLESLSFFVFYVIKWRRSLGISGESWLGWDPVDMWWDYWMFVGFGERGEKHFGELEAISLKKVKG